MAEPTATPAAMGWIEELDAIDSNWNTTLYRYSRLGRLPTVSEFEVAVQIHTNIEMYELLQNVVAHLSRRDLPAVACISSVLRALVERRLYHSVDIPYDTTRPEDEAQGHGKELWPFTKTLLQRPDLAAKVKELWLTAKSQMITPVPSASPPGTNVREQELAGTLLLQHMTGREKLHLHVIDGDGSLDPPYLTTGYMEELLPGWNPQTVHLQSLPGLQKLKELRYEGSEFHWFLVAKSPALEVLRFPRPCVMLPDGAPEEVNRSFEYIYITFRSAILNPSSNIHEALPQFLAHFPCVPALDLYIADERSDRRRSDTSDDVNTNNQGSFQVLLQMLSPIAAVLNNLCIYTADEEDYETIAFLHHILPNDGFRGFKALKGLQVPYHALFAPIGPQWAHIHRLQPISELLPPTIEHLRITSLQLALLDCLADIPYYRGDLPLLIGINVYCTHWVDESYETMYFLSYPHRVLAALCSINVDFVVEIGWPGLV
jgi:hypothetical protein